MRISRSVALLTTALVVLILSGCNAPHSTTGAISGASSQSGNLATSAGTKATAGSGPILTVSAGISHPISAKFEGTNLDFTGVAETYNEASVLKAVTSLSPGTIRYPGGAIANFWNWQTGSVNEPPSTTSTGFGTIRYKPGRQRTYGFTLSTLKQLTTATGAIPIFDLNVMTSTLGDQLQMLQAAAQLGLPIRYVELGNEFYLSNSNYLHAFPTPTSYADLVATWAPAIHAAFPGAQVAAVATVSTATPREQEWNTTLLSIAGSDINAVTLHDYPVVAEPTRTAPTPGALFAAATVDWQPVEAVMNALPSHLTVWLTEYNLGLIDVAMGSPPLGTTWEHALYVAQLDLLELASPHIALTDFWDLFGSAIDAQLTTALPPMTTPTGSASQLINQAMVGATSVTELTITNDPILEGSVKSVSGIEVTGASDGDKIILVNLGSRPIALAVGDLLLKSASAQQLSSPLSMQAVHIKSIRISGHLNLPPYSLTVVNQ